jgi:hypothetical protein
MQRLQLSIWENDALSVDFATVKNLFKRNGFAYETRIFLNKEREAMNIRILVA